MEKPSPQFSSILSSALLKPFLKWLKKKKSIIKECILFLAAVG